MGHDKKRSRAALGLAIIIVVILVIWVALLGRKGGCTADSDCAANPAGAFCDMESGMCVACRGDSGCAPGSVCDSSSYTCVGCVTDSDCGGATPACDANSQTCVACTGDSYCSGGAPVCDTDAHACVECLGDGDCGGATPACDPSSQTCVACTDNTYCDDPAAPNCNPNQQTCVGCLGDGDCAAPTPRCAPNLQTCVQCVGNSDCSNPTPACDLNGSSPTAYTCVGCLSDANCGGATPICDLDTETCVECLGDGDCGGATPVCDLDSQTCVGCLNNEACAALDPSAGVCSPSGKCVSCDPSLGATGGCDGGRLCASDKTCRFPELFYYQPSEAGLSPADAPAAARAIGGEIADPAMLFLDTGFQAGDAYGWAPRYGPQWANKGWTRVRCPYPPASGALPQGEFVYTQAAYNPCQLFSGPEGYLGWATTTNSTYEGCDPSPSGFFNVRCGLATGAPGYSPFMRKEAWFEEGDPAAPKGGVVVFGPKPAEGHFGDCSTASPEYPCVSPYIEPGDPTDFGAMPKYKNSPCVSGATDPSDLAPVPSAYSAADPAVWRGAPWSCRGLPPGRLKACVAQGLETGARNHSRALKGIWNRSCAPAPGR